MCLPCCSINIAQAAMAADDADGTEDVEDEEDESGGEAAGDDTAAGEELLRPLVLPVEAALRGKGGFIPCSRLRQIQSHMLMYAV